MKERIINFKAGKISLGFLVLFSFSYIIVNLTIIVAIFLYVDFSGMKLFHTLPGFALLTSALVANVFIVLIVNYIAHIIESISHNSVDFGFGIRMLNFFLLFISSVWMPPVRFAMQDIQEVNQPIYLTCAFLTLGLTALVVTAWFKNPEFKFEKLLKTA